MNKRLVLLILLFLFFTSFFLRSFLLPQNLFLGPEQGLDLLVVKRLVLNHKLTLIGAKTDIDGVFHGPLYYYLAAIPFLLSHGDPLIISFFFIALNCLTVFFLYGLGKQISSRRVGIIAAVLFTVSWNCIVYSRWLSDQPLSIPFSALFFLCLYRFLRGSRRDLLFAAIAFGLLTQSEFLNILFFYVITIVLVLLFLPRFTKQSKGYLVFCGLVAVGISIGTYILFDLKHQFLMTKSILSLASGTKGYHINFLQAFLQTVSAFSNAFTNTVFPVWYPGACIFLFVAILLLLQNVLFKKMFGDSLRFFAITQNDVVSSLKSLKKSILLPLLLWLCIPPFILIILRHSILDQFFVGLLPVFILVLALLIELFWQKSRIFGIILLICLIGGNVSMWVMTIPQNKQLFFQSTQPDLRYSDELSSIDTIYHQANGKPFAFQAYTIPYWEQQGWDYLFWSYGQKKYGYLPVAEKARILFVIIQSDPSNKRFQQDWLKNTVSKWGSLQKTFRHGVLTIEELKVRR